jgi:DNA recombination protein RmuC
MTPLEIILLILLVCLLTALIFRERLFSSHRNEQEKTLMRETIENLRRDIDAGFHKQHEVFQNRIDTVRNTVDGKMDFMQKSVGEKMDFSTKSLNERLDNAAKIIGSVQHHMGNISNLPAQIQDLQNIFQRTKARGIAGEKILENILLDSLPKHTVKFQHDFGNGNIVDAIVKLPQGILSIDAKFPLDNFKKSIEATDIKEKEIAKNDFRKDVKKKIREISSKYIQPAYGTLDFAIIYIPSESVFYEIMVMDEELEKYMREHNILALSPNTLYYFLQIILMGLEGQKGEQQARKIMTEMKQIQKESKHFTDKLQLLGKHLGNAKTKMDEVSLDFEKFDHRIQRTSELKLSNEETSKQIL